MRSLLEQLHDDESMLLMYLADELPTGDRQVVEQRLSRDPALQAELEKLRALQDELAGELSELDRAQLLEVRAETELKQLAKVFRSWQARRAREASAAAPTQRGRASWWLYPSSAAAAAVIIYTVWWGFQPTDPASTRVVGIPDARMFASDEGRRGFLYNPTDMTGLEDAELELDQLAMLRTMMQ